MNYDYLLNDELNGHSRQMHFDANGVFDFFRTKLSFNLENHEKDTIIIRAVRLYLGYLVNKLLDNKQITERFLQDFRYELAAYYKCGEEEQQNVVIDFINNMLGSFIVRSIGNNISYLTHDIEYYIDLYCNITVIVRPTMKSVTDKMNVYLDNIQEEGGWVSDSLRRQINSKRYDDVY